MKKYGKENLNENQKIMLTDRELTLQYLNKVPLKSYENYRKYVIADIQLINNKTQKNELKSFNLITLKQSLEILKYYQKYKNIFENILNGKYDILQDISFEIVRFSFSKYYNKKPYMSDELQILQYGILQFEALILNGIQLKFSSELLKHSLEKDPEDLLITEGEFIEKIKANKTFTEKIDQIINKNNSNEHFTENETIAFEKLEDDKINSLDLAGALHNVNIQINGIKNEKSNWNLDIIITDRYDFTKFKRIKEYTQSWTGAGLSFSNNLAMFATSCNVVHEYDIRIEFTINDWS